MGQPAKIALRGASRVLRRIEHVLVEASLVPLYEGESTFRELSALMEDCGFRFEAAVGSLESPKTGELLQIDALFRAAKEAGVKFTTDPDGRATIEVVKIDGEPAIRWRRVGGHEVFKNP